MGFVMLGLVALDPQSVSGSVLQMVNHGVSTGALFLMVGLLYERRHTRLLEDFGGLWKSIPVYSFLFLVVAISSAGLPGLNGFVGEFAILLGAYTWNPLFAVIGAAGVILAAWYLLTAFRKMAQGKITKPENEVGRIMADIRPVEFLMVLPLLLLFFIIGLFPNLFFDEINPSVTALLENQPAVTRSLEPVALDSIAGRTLNERCHGHAEPEHASHSAANRAYPLCAADYDGGCLWQRRNQKAHGGRTLPWIAIVGILSAGAATAWAWGKTPVSFQGQAIDDHFTLVSTWWCCWLRCWLCSSAPVTFRRSIAR